MRRAALGFVVVALLCSATTSALAAPSYPPVAPTPTDSGVSPMAPDPHPPLAGIAPDGHAVGGAALRSRGVILPPHAPPLPTSLTAQSWILVDLDSGAVLAARDPHGRYQPASILKLLTSDTLLPLLPGNRVVTVSKAAAETEGSRAGLVANGHYTIDELFSGLLLVSGNDTAAALAEAAGGERHTVDLMNAKALSLGAYDTFVQTPSGLDGWQQLTSAYDMALFLRAALAQSRFVAYDRALSAQLPWQSINGYGPVTMQNQNVTFLTTVPGALVAKTGYTDAAQHTFAGAVQRNGRRLGVIFLRAQRYPTDQWQQAVDLMNWGFALPKTTPAVGRLETPPPAPTTAPNATEHPSQSEVAALAHRSAASVHANASWTYALIAAIALLAVTPLAWGFVRRPRGRTRTATASARRSRG